MRIFKQPLKYGPTRVQNCARLLCIRAQHNQAVLYYLHEEGSGDQIVIGKHTGETVGDSACFVGTAMLDGDTYVLHFFA